MIPGILASVKWRTSGSVGPHTEVQAAYVNAPSFSDETETVPTAEGLDARIGFTQSFDVELYDQSVFADLNTNQNIGGLPIELVFTFDDGTVFTYDPVRVTAVPIFGQLEDKASVLIADAGTVGDPSDTPEDWESLGRILAGSAPEITTNNATDGLNRPIYVTTSLEWTMDFVDEVSALLSPYAAAKAKIAILNPGGEYLTIDQVRVSSIVNPAIGLDQLVTRQATFQVAKRDITSVLAFPTTPPKYYYGTRITGVASGLTESDVLTIS